MTGMQLTLQKFAIQFKKCQNCHFKKNCQKWSFFQKNCQWQFFWKETTIFGNFVTVKQQFSGGLAVKYRSQFRKYLKRVLSYFRSNPTYLFRKTKQKTHNSFNISHSKDEKNSIESSVIEINKQTHVKNKHIIFENVSYNVLVIMSQSQPSVPFSL